MGAFFHSLAPAYGLDPKDNKSPYIPPTDGDNRIGWCEAATEEALLENQQAEEVQNQTRYIDYLMGKQWPKNRPSYKSKPVNNRIWNIFWEEVALLTDLRPAIDHKAAIQIPNFNIDGVARALTDATHSWWLESDADQKLTQAIIWAIFNTGWTKLEWNPRLRNGYGDFDMIPLSSNHVLPLKPSTSDLDSCQAIIYRTPQPLNFFRQKYKEPQAGATGAGRDVLPDMELSRYSLPAKAPGNMTQFQFDSLSKGMQMRFSGGPQSQNSAFPMAWYREFWIKDESTNDTGTTVTMGNVQSNWSYQVPPGGDLYPRGRLIVMGGRNVILYDGPNPYWHSTHPFSCLRMNIVPWSFHGLSDLRSLIDLQDVINNILAGILDMVKRAVNPGFVAPKNAFSDSQWQTMDWSMPGYKAAYSQNTQTAPQFAPAPQLPAFVLSVYQQIDRSMDATSGLASINELIRKRQVPSAETIEQSRQTQQTPIRLKGRNIEVFLRRNGRMNIPNMFQFYNRERMLYVGGQYSQALRAIAWQPKEYTPKDTSPQEMARNFLFNIPPGSLLGINKVEQSAMYMNLRKMKDIDRKSLYRELDLPLDANEVNANLQEENQQMMQQALAAKAAAGGGQ